MSNRLGGQALTDSVDLERSRPSNLGSLFDNPAISIREGLNSGWLLVGDEAEGGISLRLGYSAAGIMRIENIEPAASSVELWLSSEFGTFEVVVSSVESSILRVETRLVTDREIGLPPWPRDLTVFGPDRDPDRSEGTVRVTQVGPRSGLVYASFAEPARGTFLYLQNLTSLNEYFTATESSGADRVGGVWPSLGFSLPTSESATLGAGSRITVGDVFLAFTEDTPEDELQAGEIFLDLLAAVYLAMPRPETRHQDWLQIAGRSLHDLGSSELSWTEMEGGRYLAAYVGDNETPPESMVQLAALIPMLEYGEWDERIAPLTEQLLDGIGAFFDPDVSSLLRWHPKAVDLLDDSEEHRQPRVMDSWYLYHPLINLSRLAMTGNDTAEGLLTESIDYAIEVAQHFDYRWPILFDVDTLEVIRAESAPGNGGQNDVGGAYALLMVQLFDLTGDTRYLTEARRAADVMLELGFDVFYQLNSTAFAIGAFHRLAEHTGDRRYRRLAELCAANVFANTWLWVCEYGHGAGHPTFFGLFPLHDAPYLAAYEEVEAVAALIDYMRRAADQMRPSLRVLIPEALKYVLDHAAYFYPPRLPEGSITERPRVGTIEPHLWIPIEDLRDGWEELGQVGQEVYGAGCAFALVARHYHRHRAGVLFCDYPVEAVEVAEHSISLRVLGDPRLTCRVLLLGTGGDAPSAKLRLKGERVSAGQDGRRTVEGALEWLVDGGSNVVVQFERDRA